MTAYDYSRLAATALRLIERFGQVATIERTALGSGPAHNPGAGATSSYACRAVIDESSDFQRDGTLIKVGDRKVMVAAKGLGIEPAVGDRVVVGGATYAVVNPKAVAPGDTVLVWSLQVRSV